MHILILGGNGRTGKLVIDEALQRGHTVTALVRNPESLETRDGLKIVQGTPLSKTDIEKAAATTPPNSAPFAIIVTLNAPRTSDNPWSATASPPHLLANANANAISVLKAHPGRSKIITLSAFGVADSWPNLNFLMRMVIKKSNMCYQWEDHAAVDKEVKESGVGFVLVRPVMMREGGKRPVRVFGEGGKGVGVLAAVTRRSVAGFMVDAVEGDEWDGGTPVISN